MKYVLAVLAIIVEFFVYILISGAIGWKHGGGILIQFLMIAIYGATWRAITKKKKDDNTSQNDNPEDIGTEEDNK